MRVKENFRNMLTVHPQYIKDTAGKNLVILPQNEFDSIMEELEDIEDIRLYDEAKKNDTGERIPMEEAFKIIEDKREKNA
jgi:PHD/YefM family antitoxin component YafN of YafNO toxin-antitoxin module